jgi:hypothetical protein
LSTVDDKRSFDRSRFYVAEQYIQASKNLIDGMLRTENPLGIISDDPISSDDLKEGIKNSSLSIILPTLFCLYQGIELILKGFVDEEYKDTSRHEAELLCEKFSVLYSDENELSALLKKFVFSPKQFIREYLELNNIELGSISEFYNSLRYPDKKETVKGLKILKFRNYNPLKYPDNDLFLPQIEELNYEIEQLLKLSVKLFKKLGNKEAVGTSEF